MNTRPKALIDANCSRTAPRSMHEAVHADVQKEGKLNPGKGISLHATDQFSKIQAAVAEISAALEDQDEHYELPLSEKYVPLAFMRLVNWQIPSMPYVCQAAMCLRTATDSLPSLQFF